MAFRRQVLDENRFSMFFKGYSQAEDIEMSLRLRHAWVLLWCGDAKADHRHVPSSRPDRRAQGRMSVVNRVFVLLRYDSKPMVSTVIMLVLDVLFMVMYDVFHAMLRGGRLGSLRHAVGLIEGAVQCCAKPPRFAEPAPRREYRLACDT
jgi:hypothetical protein